MDTFTKVVGLTKTCVPDWTIFESICSEIENDGDKMVGYFYYIDGEILGYAILKIMSNQKSWELSYLEVNPNMNKKGVGTLLLNHVRNIYREIILIPVNRSIKFYLKQGAKPITMCSMGMLLAFSDRLPTIIKEELFDDFSDKPDDNLFILSQNGMIIQCNLYTRNGRAAIVIKLYLLMIFED